MALPYVDIHTHLPQPDSPSVVAVCNLRVRSGEISRPPGSGWLTAGIHPWDAEAATQAWMEALTAFVADRRVVAVGETGLDRTARYRSGETGQQIWFGRQIALASGSGKPLLVHSVHALPQSVDMLKSVTVPILLHGFTGSRESAREWLWACPGIRFSFGERTRGSEKTTAALRYLWQTGYRDRIFLETDDGPLSIREMYTFAAGILGVSCDVLREQIAGNTRELFPQIPLEEI